MAADKKISIVVCVYNAENEIKGCLESLEKQDFQEKEIIVVDDASVDGTLNSVKEFKESADIRTVLISQPSNRGVAGSRNAGIQSASGDIIAFTDSDCVADRHWISELVKGFEETDADAVGGSVIGGQSKKVWEILDRGNNFVAAEEGPVNYIQGCNMSFKASLLRQCMFNEEIKYGFEETILCDDLVRDGYRIHFRPQAVVFHKPRNNFVSLCKLKYRRGESSVWYRKKKHMLFVYLRHLILFLSLLCIPMLLFNMAFGYLSLAFFLIFCLGLIKDEFFRRTKSNAQIFLTFPFLVAIEFAHFWGSVAGVWKFRVLREDEKN